MNENIKFEPKNISLLNAPQARPIENLCLVQKMYEEEWKAKTEHQLILRIKTKLKELDFVETLMDRAKQKVKLIGQDEVFSLYIKIEINCLFNNNKKPKLFNFLIF